MPFRAHIRPGLVAAVAAVVLGAAVTTAVVRDNDDSWRGVRTSLGAPTTASLPASPSTTAAPTTIPPPTNPPTSALATPLPGCPPPPGRPPPPAAPPWRPPVMVPESALPEPLAAPVPAADVSVLQGKGMFLWKYLQSDGGDADAIVRRATSAGLRQLWVRVGDSQDGFYAAGVLEGLVPKARAAGLAVIGWGFPYLHDPVYDAQWSAEALAWRGADGAGLDGFSPDIELASEGVVLTERRAKVYLGLVRRAAGSRLLVATVYRPSERLWPSGYPYAAIAAYVDAFAPMIYWGCLEPGRVTAEAIERLAPFRPVHVIGQGFDMAEVGGRRVPPGATETVRFLDVARRRGALGGSFWVWHLMEPEQWSALSGFHWPLRDPGGQGG